MHDRIHYIEQISAVTGQPYGNLLKKEAKHWLDNLLSETMLLSNGVYGAVGEQYGVPSLGRRDRKVYFTYNPKTCHVSINTKDDPNNIFHTLKKTYLLSRDEIDFMLRSKIKAFLKSNNSEPPMRKLKFFLLTPSNFLIKLPN